jgi:alkanesulfonate monooxygenase SsuD/methylene tetrahydromethanopterin reductase-like flavin-dependent oxidoreductase (luciferase family)
MSALTEHRLGFGVALSPAADDPHFGGLAGLVNEAQLAEDLGFDLVTVSDHMHGRRPTFEAWTALSFVAARTTRIAVAPVVLGLPYRHPAVLAKMSETLDRLSNGRLILGLGAGGFDTEFAAFGLAVRSPASKVTALREAMRILRGLWEQATVSFDGDAFTLRDAQLEPKPAHRIPIWLGSYGERSLALTGELADGWIPSLPRLGLPKATGMLKRVRDAAGRAGRNPDAVTCSANVVVRIGNYLPPAAEAVQGGTDAVMAQFADIIRAGFTMPVCAFDSASQRELFATKVLPRLRQEFG